MLLILAGITISYIAGGGLIDKTQIAMNEYENTDKKQQDIIDEINDYNKEEIDLGKTITGNIYFGDTVWDYGNAKVSINTDTEYRIQYQINGQDGEWIDLEDGLVEAKWKDEIFVRLTDGKNFSEINSMIVEDTINPYIKMNNGFTAVFDGTSKSIEVTVIENESGIAKIICAGQEFNFTNGEKVYSAGSQTNIGSNTIIVVVWDNAGNFYMDSGTITITPPDPDNPPQP